MSEAGQAFEQLVHVLHELREKCPWDRKQTLESLRLLTLEEVYELVSAIDEKNFDALKEEIGDVLVHLIFYARIAEEQGAFRLAEALVQCKEKLIRRHPHVYGNAQADNEQVVKRNWEQLKKQERKGSVLAGVPQALPAMVKAYRIQDKARQVGFDWEQRQDVWRKVREEITELGSYAEANPVDPATHALMEKEFGDVLFALVNYARFCGIDPEAALEKTNKKFINRFRFMEQAAQQRHQELAELKLAEMDQLWEEAKKLYP
ncbi:MAG: nucleoside triphosphate pyrophosphohydrolase [Chitinophagales bacterium]|nr:nucleoside triphosphate pyrophosphohydrolase [Chitinophagales bacterium]MDW8427738.1 nucleoside triphosphate pyrophosphohydrolase [Chitinophagales bacterium]